MGSKLSKPERIPAVLLFRIKELKLALLLREICAIFQRFD